MGDGQHRHPGVGIIFLHEQRQRPEMRRRPEKNDGEHGKRFKADAAGRHRPADHRRKRPGGTTDHDVLRCAPLQPDRIDHGIKEDGEGKEQPREKVARKCKHHHRQARKPQPQPERLARADPPRWHRAAAGAAHDCVYIGVIPHVERARGAAAKCNEQDRGKGHERVHRHRRHQQAHHCGEYHQRHHARLQQRNVIAELRLLPVVEGADVGHGALSSRRRAAARPGLPRPTSAPPARYHTRLG